MAQRHGVIPPCCAYCTRGGRILAQPIADSSAGQISAWKPSAYEDGTTSSFDTWFSIHAAIPELVDAEVVLAGLPVGKSEVDKLRSKANSTAKLSIPEIEILDIWNKLR